MLDNLSLLHKDFVKTTVRPAPHRFVIDSSGLWREGTTRAVIDVSPSMGSSTMPLWDDLTIEWLARWTRVVFGLGLWIDSRWGVIDIEHSELGFASPNA